MGCYYFVGILYRTTLNEYDIIHHYTKLINLNTYVEVAIRKQDKLIIYYRNIGSKESLLTPVEHDYPLTSLPYGDQVAKELNALLINTQNTKEQNYFVAFFIDEVEDPFLFKCYF